MRIGFPRALYYFDFYPFWAGFFYSLDIEFVTSQPTHRGIMESGLKMADDETCLPVKLFVGHIGSLKNVDYIFLPRMVSVEEKTYLCPKLLGIPESILSAINRDIPIITVTINWREGQNRVLKALAAFGIELGKGEILIRNAFKEALKWQAFYEELRRSGKDFQESIDLCERSFAFLSGNISYKLLKSKKSKENQDPGDFRPRIALVGHAYLINEQYANLDLVNKLKNNVDLLLIEEAEAEVIENSLKGLRKKLFWSDSKKILGAGSSYVDDETVDGIIYLSCFGCGTDSMSQDILARRARKAHKPYMVITLDEHSGEAGLVTRIEAFLDMIFRRKDNENNFSAYGEYMDNY